MSWMPKSPKARRRLWVVIAAAPVLALAVGLSLFAMRDSVTFFFGGAAFVVGGAIGLSSGRSARRA